MVAMPDFSVVGKHVLITGGTGGIGGALAKAFLDHGANVIVADITAPKDGTDPRIRYEHLDVRDDAAVEALAARVEKLDVVIHCAGRLARWEEYKPEVFKDILDIHLVGNLRLANAFRPQLKASKGCLINIGSMYSYFGAPHIPAYSAAKTGVVSLTKSLAIAFAKDGIRVKRSPRAGSRRRSAAAGVKIRSSTSKWLLAFQVANGLSRKSSQGPRFSLPQRHRS
jgi:NAD(P)-dependent dehydrogenase (short-subunit alcohol dehydrogenase family)